MCGLNVSELIAEAGLAMEFGSTAEDVAAYLSCSTGIFLKCVFM